MLSRYNSINLGPISHSLKKRLLISLGHFKHKKQFQIIKAFVSLAWPSSVIE